jgi:hypothetical protein
MKKPHHSDKKLAMVRLIKLLPITRLPILDLIDRARDVNSIAFGHNQKTPFLELKSHPTELRA